jgi:hypothetical protein
MTTDFRTWSQENLLKFAFEATQKIAEQSEEIRHLQDDLKAAMKAYRELNIKENL